MELFEIQHLSFTYPAKSSPALQDVSFTVEKGDYLLLCGQSGCGKTTLLRCFKPLLTPHGNMQGTVLFGGVPIQDLDLRTQCAKIGFVMQNPDSQIVTDKVWHELAFGLENLGFPQSTIRLRVAEMASYFGIQDWFHRDVCTLSGGQKQLLNLASVMALQPEVLILDEPTSQLDPIAAADFLNTVKKINLELGTTILLSEHRLENVFAHADKVAVLEQGRLISHLPPQEIGGHLRQLASPMFCALPSPVQIFYGVQSTGSCPMTVREGRRWLEQRTDNKPLSVTVPEEPILPSPKPPALELHNLWFSYHKNAPDVLKNASMQIPKGTLAAILGGNGTGKSTLLKCISGICRPYSGKILVNGAPLSKRNPTKIALLPQDPLSLLLHKTLRLDLEEMLPAAAQDREQRLSDIARQMEVTSLLELHPCDLSGGEQQRGALAKIMLGSPDILLLDEPTKGMDSFFKASFAALLQKLLEQEVTVVMVSHDVEFCAQYAHIAAMFFDGQILASDTPRRFFSQNSFYTTAASRMSRQAFQNAITNEDVITLCQKNHL